MIYLHDIPGYLIHRTDTKLTNFVKNRLKPFNLTPEQWTVISALHEKGKALTQKELAEFLEKDQTTLVRIIKKMENKELVKREANIVDKRSHYISLTQKSLDLKKILDPLVKEVTSALSEGLSTEEILQLKYILNKIYDNADKLSSKQG